MEGTTMDTQNNLSPEQARFFLLLHQAPYLLPLWDQHKREFIHAKVQAFLDSASEGEASIARFFLGIWLNHDAFHFDLFRARPHLDSKQARIIQEWIADPFWP
jgi:hypothetical protein